MVLAYQCYGSRSCAEKQKLKITRTWLPKVWHSIEFQDELLAEVEQNAAQAAPAKSEEAAAKIKEEAAAAAAEIGGAAAAEVKEAAAATATR